MAGVAEVGRLAFASYVDAIGEEADRLAHVTGRGFAQMVPTCPGWSVADLVGHVAIVYEHWTARLDAADPEQEDGADGADGASVAAEAGPDVLAALDGAVVRLTAALERLGPDSPCWNWSGHDLVAAWVARRMALETAVHRFDGENAVGRAAPIETELAVDGIDERIGVHLEADLPEAPDATLGGSASLVCDDADAAWTLDVAGGRVRWRRGRGPADVVLVGSASQLLLFVWNRIGPDALRLTGRRDVAEAWSSLPV